MVVGARQNFQFFRQITWFLGNNRALFKFRYRIFRHLIRIIKVLKNQSVKANFKLTARATLKVTGLLDPTLKRVDKFRLRQ